MNKLTKYILAASAAALTFAVPAFAQTILASDSASNYTGADSGNFTTGNQSSLSTGFGTWDLISSGGGGSYLGGTALSGASFGIYAGSNTGALHAQRDLTTDMTEDGNDTFSIQFAFTDLTTGLSGVDLLQDNNATIFTVLGASGNANIDLNDGGSNFSSGVPQVNGDAYTFTFTPTSATQYSWSLTDTTSGSSASATGYGYSSAPSSGVHGFQVFSYEQPGGANTGFDNVSVSAVPEPSSIAMLLSCSAFGGFYLIRRRRS